MSGELFTGLVVVVIKAYIALLVGRYVYRWWKKPPTEEAITQAREDKEGWQKRAGIIIAFIIFAALVLALVACGLPISSL